ncbi:hypothetical protein VPH35_125724 [Triticum aestivum]
MGCFLPAFGRAPRSYSFATWSPIQLPVSILCCPTPATLATAECCGSYLGLDSGVSTQEFHVFQFVEWADEHWVPPVVTGVNIYSSETGAWVAMEPKWDIQVSLCGGPLGVFLKGCLHLLIHLDGLAIVDAQGLKWRTTRCQISSIRVPLVSSENLQDNCFISTLTTVKKDMARPHFQLYLSTF